MVRQTFWPHAPPSLSHGKTKHKMKKKNENKRNQNESNHNFLSLHTSANKQKQVLHITQVRSKISDWRDKKLPMYVFSETQRLSITASNETRKNERPHKDRLLKQSKTELVKNLQEIINFHCDQCRRHVKDQTKARQIKQDMRQAWKHGTKEPATAATVKWQNKRRTERESESRV